MFANWENVFNAQFTDKRKVWFGTHEVLTTSYFPNSTDSSHEKSEMSLKLKSQILQG